MKTLKKSQYSKEFLLDIYRYLVLQRKFDTRVGEYFKQGKIVGTTHLSIGQEATHIGAVKALQERDFITSHHRGHGLALVKGADVNLTMAELFGRSTGVCRGKGGSMHIMDVSHGIIGANGIIGASLPIAAGFALVSKITETDEVTVCFFGDATSNQGTFHETLNMAAAWKLPIVFVCENNQYGVSVHIKSVTNTATLSVRSKAYDIPGMTIDGNDVLLVYETVKEAVEYARSGNGPSLIECETFRHFGHNFGDTAWYRPEAYMEEAKKKDAIDRFKKYLLENNVQEGEMDAIDQEVEKQLDAAAEYAENSPYPPISEATTGVYTTENERCVQR